MPNFQVSLTDTNNDVALSVVGSTIKIDDYSNYIASTEVGNELTRMAFKYISIGLLGSTDKYIFCVSTPYVTADEIIAAPSTFTNPLLYPPITNYYTFSGDGVYEVELVAIPEYDSRVTYALGHTVVDSGVVYESLSNSNTSPLTVAAKWSVVASDPNDLSGVSSKYRVVAYIAVDCSLHDCWKDLIYTTNCTLLSIDCNGEDLCGNPTWNNAMRLGMILDIIPDLMDDNEVEKVQELINLGGSICSCCGE